MWRAGKRRPSLTAAARDVIGSRRIPPHISQINPYLHYNGNCEAALKYYQKVLGAKIEAMFPFGDGPPEMQVPADYKTKIMHARVTIGGEVLMASYAPPGHFQAPRGFRSRCRPRT
jgi:hypothetical protein